MKKTAAVFATFALSGTLLLGVAACGVAERSVSSAQPSTADESPSTIQVGTVTNDGAKILATTTVGDTTLVIGSEKAGEAKIGEFVGQELAGWMAFDADPELAADEITFSAGNSPDSGRNGIASAYGQLGSDVTGVTIVDHAGHKHVAEIGEGWFVAAWDGKDYVDRAYLDQEYILHLADGNQRKLTSEEMDELVS